MSKIDVACQLTYEVRKHTVFLFNVAAGKTDHQQLTGESLKTAPEIPIEAALAGFGSNRVHRVVVEPCQFELSYACEVELLPETQAPLDICESDASSMPVEALVYTYPSRYCESDLLARFAYEEFGDLPRGYSRVEAICEWVHSHLEYVAGTTSATTTAAAVLLQRTGVCRDFAHLAITLCRGVGIPARYVSGYAVDLQPQDFHGFMEAFLDGSWFVFDPTRLAPLGGLVRIGIGRDAADVAFATFVGNAALVSKNVTVRLVSDKPDAPLSPEVNGTAYSTA